MHELFTLFETLPVPAGESPFHVRGPYYSRLIDNINTAPGGMKAFLDEIRDDSLRRYVQQRFQWNSWYDAFPILPMSVALARMRTMDFEEMSHARGLAAAEHLVPRMFRFMLGFTSPAGLAQHVPRFATSWFDFGQITVRQVGEGHGAGIHTGIPRYIAPAIANSVPGFVCGMISIAGGTEVTGRYVDVVPGGDRDGFELVTIEYEYTWKPASR